MINAEKYLEELRLIDRDHGISEDGDIFACKDSEACSKCVAKSDHLCDYAILRWALKDVEE